MAAGFAASAEARAAFGDLDPSYRAFPGGCTAIEPREDGGAYIDADAGFGIAVAKLTAGGEFDTSWGNFGSVAYAAKTRGRR